MENAAMIYRDITNAVFDLLLHDIQTNRFSTFAYFQLLLVFLIFMALTAFGVRLYYKALLRSMAKEEDTGRFSVCARASSLADAG